MQNQSIKKSRSVSFGQAGENPLDELIASIRLHKILKHLPSRGSLVDLGCGYHGKLLHFIESRIKQGIGLDLSVSKKTQSKKITLKTARVDTKLPIKSNSADSVTALAIIEHVQYPEILLKESLRILKPKGVLLLTTPALKSKPLLELLAFRLKLISAQEIADHKRYYSPITLHKALLEAGFPAKNISVSGFELGFNLFAKARK